LEFPEGGSIVCGPFLENPEGRVGGSYEKSLSWVGYGYFLEPHNQNNYLSLDNGFMTTFGDEVCL